MSSKLNYEVFISSPETFQVTSTLVYGENDAILFDAQISLSEAKKLAETIKKTRKNLKTIFITHGHPDHYWGLRLYLKPLKKQNIWQARKRLIS